MTDVKAYLDKLGGAYSVARKMKCRPQAVYHWCSRGKIPETSAYKLAYLYDLDPEEVLKVGRDNNQG